jgi:hypothetical protein
MSQIATSRPRSSEGEELISRAQLCTRWSVCRETIKRREKEGVLKALRFNQRLLRYRLSDILRIEAGAGGGQ